MKYILGLASTLFVMMGFGQPNFNWAVSTTPPTLQVAGQHMTTDSAGNVYVLGTFQGTVDFDPGSGTTNLTSAGNYDIFLQKLDPAGNLIWAVRMGGSLFEFGRRVAVSPANDLYVVGQFNGSASFGSFNLTSSGGSDAFVTKLDTSGNFLWAGKVGGSGSDGCYSVDFDNSGNIFLGGWFTGSVDFNPGSGTYNLASNNGSMDAFVMKLDVNHNFKWALKTGGTSSDKTTTVSVDGSGNVFTAGQFLGSMDLDPTAGVDNVTATGGDVFVQKITSTGLYSWGKVIGGAGTISPNQNAVDNSGNIITMGWFTNAIDLDPGPATNNVNTAGGFDIFFVKLSPAGNYVNAFTVGSPGNDIAYDMKLDASDNIYHCGRFDGTADFDPGSGTYNLTSNGLNDAFASKLDPNGNIFWAVNVGGSNDDAATGIGEVNGSSFYFTGVFTDTVDFDPGTGTDIHITSSTESLFTCKFGACSNTISSINPTACTSYTSPSGKYTWTASNTYTDTVKNAGGCDSVITVNLTITGPSNGTDVITSCDSLQWIDGKTYYASNTTAKHTLTGGAYNGCDSIVTLNLTIVNATTGTDVITACDSIVWIDGKTYYTNNNTATHTIAGGAANGCDSVVTLNLTINTVNATTTASNDTITANATGATYQWLDCDNNYAVISGATNQMFVASANGHYAVAVTQNSCTDTSACVTVTGVRIDENAWVPNITVYPNPTTGIINIDPGQVAGQLTMKITSIDGKVVYQGTLQSGKINNIKLNGEAGMYIVEIKSNTGASMNFRIIKQ